MESDAKSGIGKSLPAALTNHAGYLAVRLGQRSQQSFEKAMMGLEIRPAVFDFLSTISEYGPISQRELATILGIDAARIVSLTDEMEKRALAVRVVDPNDRRRNLISMTKSGSALVSRANRVAKGVENELLQPLSENEKETLRKLLRKTLGF